MKYPLLWRIASLILIFTAAVAPAKTEFAPVDNTNAKGRALLIETATATQALTALSASLEIRFQPTAQTPAQQSMGTFLAQRPGLCRIDLSSGPFARQITSDGKSVLEARPPKKTYRTYAVGSRGPTFYLAGLLPVAYFFNQKPFEEGTRREASASARYIGTETVNGEKTEVVETRAQEPQPNRVRLYIGLDKLLRRVVWTVQSSRSVATYTTTLTKIQKNHRQAAVAFTITPPPGLTPMDSPDPGATLLPVGTLAPDFTLPKVGGGTYHLADALKGPKATILNFWYVGCVPCEREFPELQRLYDGLKGQGLNFLTINGSDPDPAIVTYMKQRNLSLPAARGDDGENSVFVKYHVEVFPTTYVLDATGKIVFRAVPYDEDGLRDALTALGFRFPPE